MILFTLLIILTIFCLYRSIQPIYIYSTKEYYSSIISKSDYYIYKSMYNVNIINNSDNTRSILHYKRNNNKKAIFWISGYCDYYYHYHTQQMYTYIVLKILVGSLLHQVCNNGTMAPSSSQYESSLAILFIVIATATVISNSVITQHHMHIHIN